MSERGGRLGLLPVLRVWLVLFVLAPPGALAQAMELHGESATFAAAGMAVAWAVLRGASEDATQVVIRIAVRGGAYGYVGVDAVDPFSQARRTVLAPQPIAGSLDVRSPRPTFGEFPRREIRLYRTADEWRAGTAALTVYYLGVPDTTPEFTSEAALTRYLTDALARLGVLP